MDILDIKELEMITWIEDNLKKSKLFSPEEIFAFQLLIINFFYNIKSTMERKGIKPEHLDSTSTKGLSYSGSDNIEKPK